MLLKWFNFLVKNLIFNDPFFFRNRLYVLLLLSFPAIAAYASTRSIVIGQFRENLLPDWLTGLLYGDGALGFWFCGFHVESNSHMRLLNL